MLNKVIVNLEDRSYPIYITTNYSQIGEVFSFAKLSNKVLIVTDSNVSATQLPEFDLSLKNAGFNPVVFVLPAGEASKNLDNVKKIYDCLVENNFDRSSTIIALGGGVVGDIAGFAASTFYRGINFVQVPTTLLAQADSSVGGKVGVDFLEYKNLIGSFYQPKLVYINANSLKTLPEREIRAGLAEIVKHGIIKSPDLLEYIEYNKDKIFEANETVIQYISKENCIIKASIVSQDEKEESGIREFLNFGHTIGHAVETAHEFSLLHGECVSVGMVGAFKLAYKLGLTTYSQVEAIISLFKKLGFMTGFSKALPDVVFKNIAFDKKIRDGKIHFILPRSVGDVIRVPIPIDSMDLIREVIMELKT